MIILNFGPGGEAARANTPGARSAPGASNELDTPRAASRPAGLRGPGLKLGGDFDPSGIRPFGAKARGDFSLIQY